MTLAIYVFMMIARYLSIMIFYKLLKKHGYGFSLKDALVLTYGGVRGAVGIAFSLIIYHDKDFSDKFKSNMLLHMSGVVLLTLLSKFIKKVNATTCS